MTAAAARLNLVPEMDERAAVRGLTVAIAGLLIAGFITIAAHGDDQIALGAARARVNGAAVVIRDGVRSSLRDGQSLAPGDEVVVEDGSVVLQLAGGATLEGRGPRGAANATQVVVGEVPQLLAGDLLAVGHGLTVDAGPAVVELGRDGAATRIQRALSLTTASYEGDVTVDSAGQRRDVSALRQLTVATVGRPPAAAQPLRYDDADPWDLRYLGDAIELGRRLEALADGYTATVRAGEGVTPGFYQLVLPALSAHPEFESGGLLDIGRPAGETLVGAAISVLGERQSFEERWREVFGFRDEGATWGLVAADQAVTDSPVVVEVEQALARTAAIGAQVALGPPPAVPASVPTTAPPPSSTTSTGVTPTTGSTTGVPPPTTSPPTIEPPAPGGVLPNTGIPFVDDAAEPIDDFLGGLLGGRLLPG
ncbi:MAG: hypothetical protein ACRD0G_16760 [Acidimicrobiales bacterium]